MKKIYLKGEFWGFPGAPVEHIETHAAHVFLVADRAFKIKKDVKLPYLDFSTPDRRRAVIARELEINRLFAPDIYLGTIEKDGEPVLVMERFDTKLLLSWRLRHGGIDDLLARKLAGMAARLHAAAPQADVPGAPVMTGLGLQLSRAFTDSDDVFPAAQTLEFHALYEDALRRLKPLLDRRAEAGLLRRCHGDLHSGNIVVRAGEPMAFDAIEFSEKIATIDVLYDLAFLLMDLQRHGEKRAANIVFNTYLGERRGEEDLSGLAAMPLFLATRAGVRALVLADLVHERGLAATLAQRGEALDYFRASLAFLKPAPPRLLCIGGLSGTGKTTLGRSLAPSLNPAPGAIHVRTDVERKVLARVQENQRLPPESYTGAASLAVYDAIFERAGRALAAGHSVILDAVFARQAERSRAEEIARLHRAAFQGLWLEAPPAVLKARIASRTGDASDATEDVLNAQLGYDVGRIAWSKLDVSGSPAEALDSARRITGT